MTFRPEIDGLRAIAVWIVILFHAGFGWAQGGYVGVDVFFVISGFLITHGLISAEKTSLGSFYIRRIRRLFPALLVTVAITFIASFFILSKADFSYFSKTALLAVISLSNIGFYLDAGYWDSASELKPLLHTWSLGVEEQFYLVWPFLLLAVKGRGRAVLAVLMAVILIGGLVLSHLFISVDPMAVFYLTPFRAYQFAIGGIYAVALVSLGRQNLFSSRLGSELLVLAGLVLIIGAAFLYDGSPHYLGGLAAAPCLGALFIIMSGGSPVMGRILNNPVSLFMGRISYSLYLVHWPIFVLYRYHVLRDFTLAEQLALMLATVVAGYLLHRLVENRFRRPQERAGRKALSAAGFGLVAGGAALAFVLVAAAGWSFSARGGASIVPAHEQTGAIASLDDAGSMTGARAYNWRYFRFEEKYPGCSDNRMSCLEPSRDALNILVLGDSHGIDGYNIFEQSYPDAKILLAALPGCDTLIGAEIIYGDGEFLPECKTFLKDVFTNEELFSQSDIIVFSFRNREENISLTGKTIDFINEVAPDARIVILGNGPRFKQKLPDIIRKEKLDETRIAIPDSYMGNMMWRTLNGDLRVIADEYGAQFIDKEAFFCPDGVCIAGVEDPLQPGAKVVVTYDNHHLSYDAAVAFGNYLKLNGTLPLAD